MYKALLNSMTVCPEVDRVYTSIEYGKGAYLFDENGRKYLDVCSGKAAAANLGHGVDEIADALYQQSKKLTVYPSHFFSSKVVDNYLQKIVEFAPVGFSKAWTTTGGTEAVENAAKLAIQYHALTGNGSKYKILSRDGSYHGNSFFGLDIGGMPYRKEIYMSNMQGLVHVERAHTYRKPVEMTVSQYSKQCSDSLEEAILREGPDTVAAFVFEPVVAVALGAAQPPDDFYLKEIRRICTKYHVILIADEVLTGFGRLGDNFGVRLWNITPDIIAAGKGISAGYLPLGAIIANTEISDVFANSRTAFMSGSTYACNPLAAAVGTAVINYMEKYNVTSYAKNKGDLLYEKLQSLYKHEIVGDIRGRGLLMAIEFVKDKKSKEPFPREVGLIKMIANTCIKNGGIFYTGTGSVDGINGDHLMVMPPLILSTENIDEIVYILDKSITEVLHQL